jgi:lysophospholipase L1-like esterase
MKHALTKLLVFLFLIIQLIACSDDIPQISALDNNAVIVAFGDSLTYGSGANSATQSYPAHLAKLTGLTVINKGIPGEISQQGLKRLSTVLNETQPDLVILCHGGNDLIRKLGKAELKSNLDKMITLIKESGAQVILIGVPNFSLMLNVPELYPTLAKQHDIPSELSILPKIERDPALKSDPIHPNAQGYTLLAESIYQIIKQE